MRAEILSYGVRVHVSNRFAIGEKASSVLSSPMFERSNSGGFLKRLMAAASVVILLMLGYVVFGVLRPISRTPEWWEKSAISGVGVIQTAEAFENELIRAASMVRPADSNPPPSGLSYRSDEWVLEISQDRVNAWLAGRLPKWLANRPESWDAWRRMIGARVSFKPSGLKMGVPMIHRGVETVLWADFASDPQRANGIGFTSVDVYVGRFAAPESLLESLFDESTQRILTEVRSNADLSESLALRLDDGRVVRIRGVHFGDGVLKLVCRTEK